MRRAILRRQVPLAHLPYRRLFTTRKHLLLVEAVSCGTLVFAAAGALVWIKLPFAASDQPLRSLPLFIRPEALAFFRSVRCRTTGTPHGDEPRQNRLGLGIRGRQR